MPKVKRSTKSKTPRSDIPENLDPLCMDDLRSLCRKLNLPDTGRRNTLCRCLKLYKKQVSPPAKQDQRSKEPDPVVLPKAGSGLTWLTGKQKTELTSLIQDSIQSAIGQVVSQTTRKVLEVVGPSSQPSGQVSSRNDPRNGHDDKDPDEINSSTGEVEEEQHVEDMPSEEEPELEEESAIPIPPRSDGSLPPKPRGRNNNNNQIMGKLNDLAAQLQRLGETSVPVGLRPISSDSVPPQGNRINNSNLQAPGGSYGSNPNVTVPAKLKQEILSGEYFELGKVLPKNLTNFRKDNEDTLEILLNSSILTTKQTKRKLITDIEEWSTAFSTYMAVVVEQFPQRSLELIEYFRIIRYAANSTPGLAWVVHDHQFRTQAANDHDIYWGSIDMQLWVKLFCVSPSRLREEYDIFEYGPRNGGTRGDATCHQYSKAGTTCKRPNCRFPHRCNQPGCGGKHPGYLCPKEVKPSENTRPPKSGP